MKDKTARVALFSSLFVTDLGPSVSVRAAQDTSTPVMEYYPNHSGGAVATLAGKTLVLPTVGHGNVGQLTVDLMIQTLVADQVTDASRPQTKHTRLGCLHHPLVLPCAGVDAFKADVDKENTDAKSVGANSHRTSSPIATSLELHGDESSCPGVLWIQQRGDVVPGGSKKFAKDLTKWIKAVGIAKVCVLASLPSTAAKTPTAIGNTQYRYVALRERNGGETDKVKFTNDAAWDSCDVSQLEVSDSGSDAGYLNSFLPPWSVLTQLCLQNIDTSCLVAVCSEGDNSVDAAGAASVVADFLKISVDASMDSQYNNTKTQLDSKWTVPSSWATAYGTTRTEMF